MILFRSSWPADLVGVAAHPVAHVLQVHLVDLRQSAHAQVLAGADCDQARDVHRGRRVVLAEHQVAIHGRSFAQRHAERAQDDVGDGKVAVRVLSSLGNVLLGPRHVQLQRAEDHPAVRGPERRDHHLPAGRHVARPKVQLQREEQDEQHHEREVQSGGQTHRLECQHGASELNGVHGHVAHRVLACLREIHELNRLRARLWLGLRRV